MTVIRNLFLSTDLGLLDRITSKEGIRELVVIASQIDTQLMGSERAKFGGELPKILQNINTNILGNQLSSTLSQLKESNPEIEDTFDQLIKQGQEKVLHTSGICQTIYNQFNNPNSWEGGELKVWENLTKYYPDYFNIDDSVLSKSNLRLLANISAPFDVISNVRNKKEFILKGKKENFIIKKSDALIKYKDRLISFAKENEERINNTSIKEIEKQKKNLEKVRNQASISLNETYYDLVEELQTNIKKELSKILSTYFTETRILVDEAEDTTTEEYTVDKGRGFIFWRSLTGSRYETRSRTVSSVRTGAVRSALENLTSEIENAVTIKSQEFIHEWKKALYSRLIKELRRGTDDDDLDPQIIRSTIRNVLNNIDYPNIEYGASLPESLRVKGILKSKSAEEYIDDAREYLTKLKTRINNDISGCVKTLIDVLNSLDPSSKIFETYNNKIKNLEEQLKYKEITLERLNNLIEELQNIG